MSTIEIPVSRTKIVIPALRPEILHRARLLALFDDLLDRKLIIVAAPAGYGKTSLLVDFSRQSGMPVCWFSLDALDKDPQRFCAYLIAALEQRFPKFGKQSDSVLRSLTNFEQDTEHLISVLINEIDRQIDEHFALVVDDYQFVDGVPAIRELFSRFVYLAGENCHVVLSSRRLPTLPDITVMVARQQVGGFDLEQLAFRPDEIRSLFETNYGITLPDSTVDELMRQTEGWITGLHLSASSATSGVPDLTQAARLAGVDLAGYLDQQVLAPQAPELHKFLLQTSLLEEFDADLCEAVLGAGNWKKLIKTVRQNNLFVLPVGPDGKWLRYHHLFQEFLQVRIREEEPETAQAILLRLGEVYKERREWEKAYAIYHQSGNPDILADLVELAGTPMLLSERLITLQTWLEDLPTSLLQERPSLLSLKGALLCALGEGNKALTLFNQAIPELRNNGDVSGLALALVRRAAAYRLVGDYVNSIQDADDALQLGKDKQELEPIWAEAERFKGLGYYYRGQVTEAAQFLDDALKRYEKLDEGLSVARVQMELGMTFRAKANYLEAQSFYEQALAIWRRANNLPSQASALNSLGVLYHLQGDYEPALKAFEEGLKYAKQAGSDWRESVLLTSLGDLYTDLDEFESAGQAYTQAALILRQVNHQFLSDYLSLALVRLARLRGRLIDARHELSKAQPLIQVADSNYECGLFYLERGCLQLKENDPAIAITDFQQALDCFRNGSLTIEITWSQIWLAAAYFSSGEVEAARSFLQAALQMEPSLVGPYPLLPTLRQARPWLAPLQSDAEVGTLMHHWLELVTQAEARLPGLRIRLRRLLTTIPIQAPHMTIQAFGKAQVRTNGKLVTLAQWKTASVRELFFFLLAASRPLAKEEIGAILWPEIDTDQLKLRFKNDLYRLRHALGQNVILFEDNLYHFNRNLDYEYDVENFAAYLKKAKAVAQIEDKIANLQAATELRNGFYLQDIDASWVWPERENLDQACMDAIKFLTDMYRQTGDLRAALQACQKALKIDPSCEDLYCLAMQLHHDLGDRLAVIWQYQACRAALRTELDVAPSSETEALYRRLTV
jgi:LuxR family maltose regulon positive regulatory protein